MASTYPPSTLAYLNHLYAESRRNGVFHGSGACEFADYAVWARPELARRIGLDAIRESAEGAAPSVTLGAAEDLGNYTRAKGVLRSEPHLDIPSRTFVMGNSGGGVASLYAAACDERIRAAIASCSFCSYVGKTGVVSHCDGNAVPGILTFGEFHDVAGLIAPRRLLVVHGKTDPHFPPDKVKRSVERLRERFANAGAGNSFHHAWGSGGHRFYGDRMWPWLEKNLGTR